MAKKKDLKATVEEQLAELLADEAEPSEGRMKLLKLGIAYLAVNAKLEESSYGEFFNPNDELGDAGGLPQQPGGEKPHTRRGKKRTNGAEERARAEPSGEGIGIGGEGT